MTRRPGEAGSALVEAMVAAAILAVTLGVAARAVGDGARRTAAAERSRLAMLEARSRLAEVGADIALAPGVSSGEDGALGWRVLIAPASEESGGRLLDVRVGVSAGGGREIVQLHSLRLAPPPPAAPAAS